MSEAYKIFFGFHREPFTSDVDWKDILVTPELKEVHERLLYTIRLGAISVMTGEVGAGKSTALRWSMKQLHSSEYRILWVTASSGSILELYRQLLAELEIDTGASSRSVLTSRIRQQVKTLIREKRQKPILVVDEASLLRLDVFTELHTISQFEGDSKPWLPIILAGQANLIDKLHYRNSAPLASRVVARTHLESTTREMTETYLRHHLKIAGVKHTIFEEPAINAIHQGSGGLFRRMNHLARGSLIAATHKQTEMVNADHVRVASSELI